LRKWASGEFFAAFGPEIQRSRRGAGVNWQERRRSAFELLMLRVPVGVPASAGTPTVSIFRIFRLMPVAPIADKSFLSTVCWF
jgi:hypothetical protein